MQIKMRYHYIPSIPLYTFKYWLGDRIGKVVEMQNSEDTLENSLQFLTDINMLFYMNQNHAPWYLSKKAEMSIQKSEHNVHSSFHNCQNLETTYMSFGR